MRIDGDIGRFWRQASGKRGALLLAGMVSERTACLRKAAGGERSGIVQFSRFLANANVTVERIVEGWGAATSVAVRGRDILAIQDTSEIGFKTTAERRRGLGEIGKGNKYGLLLHAMVAVDADSGNCLGLVDGTAYTRSGRRKVCHTERSLEDKETKRWVETARGAAVVLSEAARVTVVADAESDFYAGMVLTAREGLYVLSRSGRNRCLSNGSKLYDTVAGWSADATRALFLRAQPGRPARTAEVELRFGEVDLKRPDKTEPDMPTALRLRVVEVREPDPPEGVEPVCWRLLSTHAVDDVAKAWWIVRMYQYRWVIEQMFRLMKSQGLGIEDSQVDTAERLLKLAVIAARAAVVTLQLVQARDGDHPEPAVLVFDEEAVEALAALSRTRYAPRTEKQRNPHASGTLAWAAWIIARLGGWDGYQRKKPGPITMIRGLEKFKAVLVGWAARNV